MALIESNWLSNYKTQKKVILDYNHFVQKLNKLAGSREYQQIKSLKKLSEMEVCNDNTCTDDSSYTIFPQQLCTISDVDTIDGVSPKDYQGLVDAIHLRDRTLEEVSYSIQTRESIDSWCSTTKKVMDDKMDELFEMRERDHVTLGYMVWIQLWTRKIQLLRVELAKYGDVFDTIVELTRRFVVE